MCGIAVIVSKTATHPIDAIRLDEMTDSLIHRGPDSRGRYVGKGIGLGMTRLQIVGGTSGQQPIWNEGKTVAVVCNGEIYNYQELRETLMGMGHTFGTDSDVEVIVHLYEEFGQDVVHYLQGTYAFAIWDQIQHQLLVVRDRIGVKPVYYSESDTEISFSSEMRSFSPAGTLMDWNHEALEFYHAYRFVPGNGTVDAKVNKIPPAHLVLVRNGQLQITRYWLPATASIPREVPLHTRVQTVRRLIMSGVASQWTDEVKTGVLLSGGLDSTALLALQKKLTGVAPTSFTVGFERPSRSAHQAEYDEIGYARDVAAEFGSPHVTEIFSASDVLRLLPRIIRDLDEPIADPTAIPLWLVSRLARGHSCKVIYSGEGLDELFGGYSAYQQVRWHRALNYLPISIRRFAFDMIRRLGLPGEGLLRRNLQPIWHWYQGIGSIFSPAEQAELFQESIFEHITGEATVRHIRNLLKDHEQASTLKQMLYFDVMTWLPDNTLTKSDKISMAHALELRVPFVDQDIVDYALQLTDRDKLHGRTGKWIVREALGDLIPETVLGRKKAGFPVPLTAWMFGEWREFVYQTLMNSRLPNSKIYRADVIGKLFSAPPSQQRRAARLLWALLSLELWYGMNHGEQIDQIEEIPIGVRGERWQTVAESL